MPFILGGRDVICVVVGLFNGWSVYSVERWGKEGGAGVISDIGKSVMGEACYDELGWQRSVDSLMFFTVYFVLRRM